MRRADLYMLVLLAAGCSTPSGEENDGTPDAGRPPAVELPSILDEPLDSLSPAGAETLCREDARRFDPCLEVGLSRYSPEFCNEAQSGCRAEFTDAAAPYDCSRVELGPPGSCAVTVESYLACVDDWNVIDTCENVGNLLETPSACTEVVELCPRLATRFYRNGAPPQCAPETAARPPRTEEDIYGFDGCRPKPKRFVILGDSIAACYAVQPAECGPQVLGAYVRDTFAPELTIESHASSGSFMAELPAQARKVEGGPGHVVVWIHILGNDLALRHVDYDAWDLAWAETFGHFTDAARFPDGATFLLNTQYSPYDQCPDPLGGDFSISAAADRLLQDVNRRVFLGLAEERADTVAIDQYPDWLGHGNNANVRDCPHCGSDNTKWMAFDRIHPNALGYVHMVEKWKVALDRMYAASCGL